jgi:membrane-bound ClpP family serine protease
MPIYIICLAVGLLYTLTSLIFGHFGGHEADVGTGGHAEAGYDHSGVPGISFFSPTVLASFVTAFGAAGLVFSHIALTQSVWISAPLSGLVGSLLAFLTFLLFNWIFQKTQGSSESRVVSLIGHTASIVTPIPANGVGEIAYIQGGTRYTAPARTENGEPIGHGQPVRIHRIVGAQYFVQILK